MNFNQTNLVEYVIVGAGPAGICAIPNIIATGVNGDQIIWIDNGNFAVGAFGTTLSEGSSVPGNTSVASYQIANNAIYETIPRCQPQQNFTLDSLPTNNTCPINIAAEPIRHISNKLCSVVNSIAGLVTDIIETQIGLAVTIKLALDNSIKIIHTKRCILAIGAIPKLFALPNSCKHVQLLDDPNIVFTKTRLAEYLQQHPEVKNFGVIGSSHSAALASMHLLQAGVNVKQFMNKEYKFAEQCIASDGTKYTKFDNTGLKGDVAAFTKKLLQDQKNGMSSYQQQYQSYIGTNQPETNHLIAQHLKDCSHAVATIGYTTAPTLKINNLTIDNFSYNKHTTEFHNIKGLFGIGIAFPLETTAISGEVEFSVGYLKFWSMANNPKILKIWRENVRS